jgi:predicted permease
MKWRERTHGTKFELVRHFLARMFDSEMFSTRGQGMTVAVSALALAIPAGMLLLDPPYMHRAISSSPVALRAVAIADQLAMLTLIGAVTGVLALLVWQSLFPSRRDHLALAGLPVRPRQIFAARFASVVLIAAALALAMSVLPSVMTAHQFTAGQGAEVPPVTVALARAASYGLECLFVFFAIVSVQGMLINTLSQRLFERVSAWVQGALMTGCFLAGLYSWFIVDWTPREINGLASLGAWAPPVWFAGLHQVLTGDRDPFFSAMALRGVVAAAGSVIFAGLMYLMAFARYGKALIESPDAVAPRGIWRWSFLGLLSREPRQAAILRFMGQVLSRSRVHRMVLMSYAGAGLAIMINSLLIAGAAKKWSGWHEILRFVVLYWPVGLSFVAVAGARHAFSMPAEWKANWLFQITESQGRRAWMTAVERFVVFCVIAPIHVLTLPLAIAVLGWPVAVRMTILQALVSLTAFEFLFYDWQQIPFVCSYVPGKRPLMSMLARWMAVFCALVPILASIIATVSQMIELFLIFFVVFSAVWLWARSQRREGWGEGKLIYEDPHGAMPDLGISDVTYRFSAQDENCSLTFAARIEAPTVSLRVYRALARAMPAKFKSSYGEEMLQMAEDTVESTWQRHGVLGLVRLLWDISIRVPAEHLADLWQDVRYGLRMLAGSPGFTAVAVISLSLGICIGTSAFSLMRATILRDLPAVMRPDELVALQSPSSYPSYRRYRERYDLFSFTTAYTPAPFSVLLEGRSQRIWGHLVTPWYFTTLGVQPALGRVFGEEQERPGGTLPVVVSYRFWQSHLGSDPSAAGRTLRINGRPFTVIGVGPKEFLGASPVRFVADLWIPISAAGQVAPELAGNALERPDLAIFQVVGRLMPGVPVTRAEAALDAVARQMEQEQDGQNRNRNGRRVLLVMGGRLLPVRAGNLPMMMASPMLLVGLMLLIACSNVANMMLARTAGRRREIAVRLALGASRGRLIRQLLTESLLVATSAGVLGFLLTVWLMGLLSRTGFLRFSIGAPYPMPVSSNLSPDGHVLLLTFGLALFTALGFGLLPALRATRADLATALKEGGNIRFRRFRRLSLRNVLVIAQVAGSLTLLLLTGMLATGYQKLMALEVGFDPTNFYLISLDPVRDGYSVNEATVFLQKLLERLKRLPSVASASWTETVPVVVSPSTIVVSAATTLNADKYVVGKDYFETIGVPVLLGRGFRREDEANDAPAVIVSERLARDLWQTASPLGRWIEVAGRRFEVVGVTRNVKVNLAAESARPAIYFALKPDDLARPSFTGVTLMVRTAPGVDAIGVVRREISALDEKLTPFNAVSLPEEIGRLTYVFRLAVWIHWFEGVFGLILASVGLAGMTAYSVVQRRREIGIRIALGAQPGDVLRLIMKEGVVLVAVGTVFGLAGGLAGMRVLAGIMSAVASTTGKNTLDPLLLVGAPLLLAALALMACYVPARKSLRVDPVVALRQE